MQDVYHIYIYIYIYTLSFVRLYTGERRSFLVEGPAMSAKQ